ncbi:MAG: sulfotransferase [Xanthomonadaceae bacterium]|nr:sulfotransferase [Xanthomonadaceae bacterium]MDE2257683.1 sulfotransferase [Xanthomonadaceae bacterium]
MRATRGGGEASHWYVPTVWHTLTFHALWRLLRVHGFRIGLSRLFLVASVTFATIANSLLGLLQSAIYGSRLRAVNIQAPVFVLGHWRSGTTHLHELLALDDRLAFPTTYEVFAPHHCLLTERIYRKLFAWLLPRKRAMDDMAVGFDRPQEDEFALVALGAPSPMWSLAYPGETIGQAYLSLRDVPNREREHWADTLRKFLRLVTYRHPKRSLVLKSPAHTARIEILSRMFPDARFIHIVRDPCAVFASTVHLWRKAMAVNALVPFDDFDVEKYVLETLPKMYERFAEARDALASGHFHQMRYEDLVQNPLATLEECYKATEMDDFDMVRSRVADYVASLREFRVNEYEISQEAKIALRDAWSAIFQTWGYTI